MVFSNEIIFHISEHVNKHSCVFLVTDNPHIVHGHKWNSPNTITLYTFTMTKLIGLHFFLRFTILITRSLQKRHRIHSAITNLFFVLQWCSHCCNMCSRHRASLKEYQFIAMGENSAILDTSDGWCSTRTVLSVPILTGSLQGYWIGSDFWLRTW